MMNRADGCNKSTLSADVPPFIPKTLQPELGNSIVSDNLRNSNSSYSYCAVSEAPSLDSFGWSSPFYVPPPLSAESSQWFQIPRFTSTRSQQHNTSKLSRNLPKHLASASLSKTYSTQPFKDETVLHKNNSKADCDLSFLLVTADEEQDLNQNVTLETNKKMHATRNFVKSTCQIPEVDKSSRKYEKTPCSKRNEKTIHLSSDNELKIGQLNRNEMKNSESWCKISYPFVHNFEEFPDLTTTSFQHPCSNEVGFFDSISTSDIPLSQAVPYSEKLKSLPLQNRSETIKIKSCSLENSPLSCTIKLDDVKKCLSNDARNSMKNSLYKGVNKRNVTDNAKGILFEELSHISHDGKNYRKDSLDNYSERIVRKHTKNAAPDKQTFCQNNLLQCKKEITRNKNCEISLPKTSGGQLKHSETKNQISGAKFNSTRKGNISKNDNSMDCRIYHKDRTSKIAINQYSITDTKGKTEKNKTSKCSSANSYFLLKKKDDNQGEVSSSSVPVENHNALEPKSTKKKKSKKKSKKMPFAMSGKISILTPEMHSLITGETDKHTLTEKFESSMDLSNAEEYPELGEISLSHSTNWKTEKMCAESKISFSICESNSNETKQSISDYPTVEESDKWKNNQSTRTFLAAKQPFKSNLYSDVLVPHKKKYFVRRGIESKVSQEAKEDSLKENLQDEDFQFVKSKKQNKHKEGECNVLENKLNSAVCHINKNKSEEVLPSNEGEKTKPKTHTPILFTMADIINSSQKVKKQKDFKLRVISSKRCLRSKIPLNPHNILDSSAPVRKRGKEREKPRKKKQSLMKKTILKEREEKKLHRMMQNELKDKIQTCTEVVESDAQNSNAPLPLNCETEDSSSSSFDVVHQSSVNTLPPPPETVHNRATAVKIVLHTRNFREYCTHLLSEEIDNIVKELLSDLIRFQDRMHQKDPVKASMRRRLVYGLKEVTKYLHLNKLKCILLAPDLERIQSKGGLDDVLTTIITLSENHHIPCVFALLRRKLGRACLKSVPVSCVGICSYSGSEEKFKILMELQTESIKAYNELFRKLEESITDEEIKKLLEASSSFSNSEIYKLRTTILRNAFVTHIPSPSK